MEFQPARLILKPAVHIGIFAQIKICHRLPQLAFHPGECPLSWIAAHAPQYQVEL
jgi:hypothetical protein